MTVYKRGEKWQAQAFVHSRKIGSKTFRTKGEAEKWERDAIAEFDPGVHGNRERRFEDLVRVFRERRWRTMKPRTQTRYDLDIERRIVPFFQYRRLQTITRHDWEDFLAWMDDDGGLSRKSQRNCAGIAASMFRAAHDWQWIRSNPTQGVELPAVAKADYRWWESKDDMRRFLEAAKSRLPAYYPAFRLALETGMRVGEIVGLDRGDVDLKTGLIRITRQWHDTLMAFGPTKNSEIRTLDISGNPPLLQALREAILRSGHKDAVFSTSTGERVLNRSLYHRFQNCIRYAEVPRIRMHDTRHTYASHFLRDGGSVWELKKILGHADIQTTQRYAHHEKGAAKATPLLSTPPADAPQVHRRQGLTEL